MEAAILLLLMGIGSSYLGYGPLSLKSALRQASALPPPQPWAGRHSQRLFRIRFAVLEAAAGGNRTSRQSLLGLHYALVVILVNQIRRMRSCFRPMRCSKPASVTLVLVFKDNS